MNPLVPSGVDGGLMTLLSIAGIFSLAAFISVIRSAPVSGWTLLAWSLVVLFVPLIGSVGWFIVRHRARSRGAGRDAHGP